MSKRRLNCKFCDSYFYEPSDYVAHIEKYHDEMIPEEYTAWQFVYFLRTGKANGKCVMCGKETKWNEVTHKYNRFCGCPKCKEKYIKMFRERMIGKYGKVNLLDDPEQQKLMLSHRSISGVYQWSMYPQYKNTYTGSYERSFLEYLDYTLQFNPEDVISPSPHTYYYMYESRKHFYIPDFFIPSLNLEIEIKDGGSNPNMHHKIQEVDKVKEKLKDEVMLSNRSTFNYIKIVNKENDKLYEFLEKAKENFFNGIQGNIVML